MLTGEGQPRTRPHIAVGEVTLVREWKGEGELLLHHVVTSLIVMVGLKFLSALRSYLR